MVRDEADEGSHVPELSELSARAVEPARSDRTRARCHQILRRRRERSALLQDFLGSVQASWRVLEPALLSLLAILYLGGAFQRAFFLLGR